MHENASMTASINDSEALLITCLNLLPRTSGAAGKTQDEILTEKAVEIHSRVPPPFDIEAARSKYKVSHEESMNTVLIQELIRFNGLISVVRDSVLNLKDAIAGVVIMSGDLEELGISIFDNKVPDMWANCAYPSRKPLGAWINDLLSRLSML